eukprot:TRINITY_DN20815_c0_g1_i1.p1 TRINITY_DN20815_c0_g1~~TRINITY_DN20815_c0_g1_i1.p1  ORF type:complete len:422 (-),score=95.41 TRINITY_DN20815_c0_g1_i1:115-1380(-)
MLAFRTWQAATSESLRQAELFGQATRRFMHQSLSRGWNKCRDDCSRRLERAAMFDKATRYLTNLPLARGFKAWRRAAQLRSKLDSKIDEIRKSLENQYISQINLLGDELREALKRIGELEAEMARMLAGSAMARDQQLADLQSELHKSLSQQSASASELHRVERELEQVRGRLQEALSRQTSSSSDLQQLQAELKQTKERLAASAKKGDPDGEALKRALSELDRAERDCARAQNRCDRERERAQRNEAQAEQHAARRQFVEAQNRDMEREIRRLQQLLKQGKVPVPVTSGAAVAPEGTVASGAAVVEEGRWADQDRQAHKKGLLWWLNGSLKTATEKWRDQARFERSVKNVCRRLFKRMSNTLIRRGFCKLRDYAEAARLVALEAAMMQTREASTPRRKHASSPVAAFYTPASPASQGWEN